MVFLLFPLYSPNDKFIDLFKKLSNELSHFLSLIISMIDNFYQNKGFLAVGEELAIILQRADSCIK